MKSILYSLLLILISAMLIVQAENEDAILVINNNSYKSAPLGLEIFYSKTKKWKTFGIDEKLLDIEIDSLKGTAFSPPIYSKNNSINWGVACVQAVNNNLLLVTNLHDRKKFKKSLIAFGSEVGKDPYISKIIWVPYKKGSDKGQLVGIGSSSLGGFVFGIDKNDLFVQENDIGQDKWKFKYIDSTDLKDYYAYAPFLTDIATDGNGQVIITGRNQIWKCDNVTECDLLPWKQRMASQIQGQSMNIFSSITYNNSTNNWYIYGSSGNFNGDDDNYQIEIFQIKIAKLSNPWEMTMLNQRPNELNGNDGDGFVPTQAFFTHNNYLLLNLFTPFAKLSCLDYYFIYPEQQYTKNTFLVLKDLHSDFIITDKTESSQPEPGQKVRSPMYTCLTSDNQIIGIQLCGTINDDVSYFNVAYMTPNNGKFKNFTFIENSHSVNAGNEWFTLNPKINPILPINVKKYKQKFPKSPL